MTCLQDGCRAGYFGVARHRLREASGLLVETRRLAADQLFIDPANGDLRLKAGSAAVKLGFIPIDLSKVGLRDTP